MVFPCCDRFGHAWDFYVTTEHFCVATEFGLGQRTLCRDRVCISRQSLGQGQKVSCRNSIILCRDMVGQAE